jgi:hypothetical protein
MEHGARCSSSCGRQLVDDELGACAGERTVVGVSRCCGRICMWLSPSLTAASFFSACGCVPCTGGKRGLAVKPVAHRDRHDFTIVFLVPGCRGSFLGGGFGVLSIVHDKVVSLCTATRLQEFVVSVHLCGQSQNKHASPGCQGRNQRMQESRSSKHMVSRLDVSACHLASVIDGSLW